MSTKAAMRKRLAKRGKNKSTPLRQKLTKVNVPLSGFPDRTSVMLKYVERKTHTTTGTPYYNYLWRANSIYDPDFTATGHQPLFYDQYTPIYSNWIVKGVKITAQISNASQFYAANACMTDSTVSTAFTDMTVIMEQPTSVKTITIPPTQQLSRNMTYKVDCAKALGITRAQYLADSVHWGSVSNDPTTGLYIHSHYESANYSNDVFVDVIYTLEFYVDFFNRKDVAQS